ncbi:valine--tRNA ligase [Helicobacter sp. MIT 14-3879]|uniref:valine--tRNA ligase n=1 Tax=Helicobacter sp. MIT 14-3879 TaxID=2040649 RepID=UPI000E1E9E67|nr:valine--tRNA ligase [Helicobacter sp. MIT 14-3879]RDU64758.1 valine--tRNA ligase [Helicobacter sp. MIT 14-3879]
MIYNAKEVEQKYYSIWENRGYFELDSNKNIDNGKNFSIMMPPPNVTGFLHMGHALTYSLQDIIVRFKRMQGYRTLWQPGIDHAGIATQNVVERKLLSKGIKKEDIGRDEFIKEVWKWKEESGSTILSQLRRLGVSANWSRTRFTMDKGLQNAVKKAFVKWYNESLIYQGNYMVNWCTHDGALSDIEVEYEENKGKLYYLRYPIKNDNSKQESNYIIVATTRPETFFGDTAVMVNPNDERYKHLIGKKVILPLVNKEIIIIADSYVDMGFGTGCVKVTPAHDINDYEVGKRHNLEFITVFDKFGILNSNCGEFSGLERLEARDKIVEKLQERGFIEKIESYKNQVGRCYRCGNIVEPYISKQWFVKKDIANETIKLVNNGECKFYPNQWINNFNAWMNELRPWCISRQLWWGHRIPIFYCDKCDITIASVNNNEVCKACGCEMRQDEDVLDTWFSSGLWAFSTLGWGNELEAKNSKEKLYNKSDLDDFYPNSLLITSFDILFFWVARMLFSSQNILKKLPFKDIYLHALVCDELGKKMSKSKGNVINPIDLIEDYSSDILRFSLAYYCIQGRDIKIGKSSLEIGNALSLKVQNALNFLLLYKKQQNGEFIKDLESIKTKLGKYIFERFNICVKDVIFNLENYRFNDAAGAIYKFLLNDFCDWGIEFVKTQKDAVFELGFIFKEAMKLLHPFMPFLSEFAFQSINGNTLENSSSIMLERFPKYKENINSNEDFEMLKDVITSIRRAKIPLNLGNKNIDICYVRLSKNIDINLITFISKSAKVTNVEIVDSKIDDCIIDIGEFCEVYIPTNNINKDELKAKLQKKKEKINVEINKLESMLSNDNFLKNAPKELIESNSIALNEAKIKLEKLNLELQLLK